MGHRGHGVWGKLTLATADAVGQWADIMADNGVTAETETWLIEVEALYDVVSTHVWDKSRDAGIFGKLKLQ